MQTVEVIDYDPRWPAQFEELRILLWPAVEGAALTIEHIGSTWKQIRPHCVTVKVPSWNGYVSSSRPR